MVDAVCHVNSLLKYCCFRYTTTTTVLRPFVRDYLGESVPEETLTQPPCWSSSNLYQLLLSATIHIASSLFKLHAFVIQILTISVLSSWIVWSMSPRPPVLDVLDKICKKYTLSCWIRNVANGHSCLSLYTGMVATGCINFTRFTDSMYRFLGFSLETELLRYLCVCISTESFTFIGVAWTSVLCTLSCCVPCRLEDRKGQSVRMLHLPKARVFFLPWFSALTVSWHSTLTR